MVLGGSNVDDILNLNRTVSSRDQISGANVDREILIFLVQLTTSRIGNHARLIDTLAICVTIYTYMHNLHDLLCMCLVFQTAFSATITDHSDFSLNRARPRLTYNCIILHTLLVARVSAHGGFRKACAGRLGGSVGNLETF